MPKKTAQGSTSSDNKPSLLQITITYSRQNITKKDLKTLEHAQRIHRRNSNTQKVRKALDLLPLYFFLMVLCLRHTQGTTKILK